MYIIASAINFLGLITGRFPLLPPITPRATNVKLSESLRFHRLERSRQWHPFWILILPRRHRERLLMRRADPRRVPQ